jgi:HPr serine kinase-like protein
VTSPRSSRFVGRAFGLTLASDVLLPEIEPAPADARPDFQVSWRAAPLRHPPLRWSRIWPAADGQPEVSSARDGARLYFRFGTVATIEINGAAVHIAHARDADLPSLRHMFLDQCLPLLLAARGELVVHASAVAIGDAAILLAGEAGHGKSTLAATMVREGAVLLADDAVVLHEVDRTLRAVPSYPGLRLRPDAARFLGYDVPAQRSAKQRVLTAASSSAASYAVSAVFAVGAPGPAADAAFPAESIRALTRRDAVMELLRHAFVPDPADREWLARLLERAARAAAMFEGLRVGRTAGLDAVPATARQIIERVQRMASGRLLSR